jgi:hypothetical protein
VIKAQGSEAAMIKMHNPRNHRFGNIARFLAAQRNSRFYRTPSKPAIVHAFIAYRINDKNPIALDNEKIEINPKFFNLLLLSPC